MYYNFNENNNITGYIKEVLYNFNLPTYKVYTSKTNTIPGRIYIKENNVYKCVVNKTTNEKELVEIGKYNFNDRMFNYTTNLLNNSSTYDRYTHEYLGKFLRFIRDYKGLDLMPLYNCFGKNQLKNLKLNVNIVEATSEKPGITLKIDTEDDNFNYYIVPVIYDQDYTIAIDSAVPYEVCCMILTNTNVLDQSIDLVKDSYKVISGSKFTSPFVYRTPSGDKYWKWEEVTNLLIKLPKRVNSSITILEGNYINNASICGGCLVPKYLTNDDMSGYQSSKITPPTKLSLLAVNDGKSYPFADRLVEYLLQNAITQLDEIDENIQRIQDIIYYGGTFKGIYGV